MQRMLRYAGFKPTIVKGVKHFRGSTCEKPMEKKKVPITRIPDNYTFGENVGTDIFEVRDYNGDKYQVIHEECLGTTYQSGEILGPSKGGAIIGKMPGLERRKPFSQTEDFTTEASSSRSWREEDAASGWQLLRPFIDWDEWKGKLAC